MPSTRAAVIAHRASGFRNLLIHDWAKRLGGHIRNVMRPNLAAAFNEREYSFFALAADVARVALAAMLVRLLAADIRFVKLNSLALATKRASRLKVAHTFANAMAHEPRGFVRQADHAVKLMRAHSLFAGAHQMRRQKPFRHRDMRAFVNRADRSRELLPAVFAVIPARPHGLAAQRRYAVKGAAERAIATLRPADRFEVRPRLIKVRENRVRKINSRGHWPISLRPISHV